MVKGKEIVVDLNFKLKASGKRTEDDAYERHGWQDCLQQFPHKHDRWVKAFLAI